MSFHQGLQNEQTLSLLAWQFIFLSLVSTCSATPTLPCSMSVHLQRGLTSYLNIPWLPVEPQESGGSHALQAQVLRVDSHTAQL